jgi:FXSXX-COOH protein
MASQGEELRSIVPDLRDLPLEELAKLGDSVLAHSLALYRQRLTENGMLLSNFSAKI